MAITAPTLTPVVSAAVCADVEYLGSTLRFALNPDQMAGWTDDELTSKMAALKAAIGALLPSNMPGVRVYVEWDSSASVNTNPS